MSPNVVDPNNNGDKPEEEQSKNGSGRSNTFEIDRSQSSDDNEDDASSVQDDYDDQGNNTKTQQEEERQRLTRMLNNNTVSFLRIAVYAVVLLTTIVVCGLVHQSTMNEEIQNFEDNFAAYADKLTE